MRDWKNPGFGINDELECKWSSLVVAEGKRRKATIQVFTDSFDADGIHTDEFFNQKLKYIHCNPVSSNWKLVTDYPDYEPGSASFYETGEVKNYQPFDYWLL